MLSTPRIDAVGALYAVAGVPDFAKELPAVDHLRAIGIGKAAERDALRRSSAVSSGLSAGPSALHYAAPTVKPSPRSPASPSPPSTRPPSPSPPSTRPPSPAVGLSNKVKYFGVGWKKTGTTSLSVAYRLLGLEPQCKCSSLKQMKAYVATQDVGFCCDLDLISRAKTAYPAARFILTERDPHAWNVSVIRWLRPAPSNLSAPTNCFRGGGHCWGKYRDLMGGAIPGSRSFVQRYRAHNAAVRDAFSTQQNRLLVLNLELGDPVENLQRLCEFTNRSSAKACRERQPFPQANKNIVRNSSRKIVGT